MILHPGNDPIDRLGIFPDVTDPNTLTHHFTKGVTKRGIMLGAMYLAGSEITVPGTVLTCVASGLIEVLFGQKPTTQQSQVVLDEIKKVKGDIEGALSAIHQKLNLSLAQLDDINDHLSALTARLDDVADQQERDALCATMMVTCDFIESTFPGSKAARAISRTGKAGVMMVQLHSAWSAMKTVTPLGALNLGLQAANIGFMLASIFMGGGSESSQIQALYERLDQMYDDIMHEFADVKRMLGDIHRELLAIKQHLHNLSQLTENGVKRLEDQLSKVQHSIHTLPAVLIAFSAFNGPKQLMITRLSRSPENVTDDEIIEMLNQIDTWGVRHATTLPALTHASLARYDALTICEALGQNDPRCCVGYLNNLLQSNPEKSSLLPTDLTVCNPVVFVEAIEAFRQVVVYYIAKRNQIDGVARGLGVLDSKHHDHVRKTINAFYQTARDYYAWIKGLQNHATLFDQLFDSYVKQLNVLKHALFEDKTKLRDGIQAAHDGDPVMLGHFTKLNASYYQCRAFVAVAFPNSMQYDPYVASAFSDVGMFCHGDQVKDRLVQLAAERSEATQLEIACDFYFQEVLIKSAATRKLIRHKQAVMRQNPDVTECDEVLSLLVADLVRVSDRDLLHDLALTFDLKGVDCVPVPSPHISEATELTAGDRVEDCQLALWFGDVGKVRAWLSAHLDTLSQEHIREMLFAAVHLNQPVILDWLIKFCATVSIPSLKDPFHQSLLHVAAASGAYLVVPYLVDAKMDLREKNDKDQNPQALVPERDKDVYARCIKMGRTEELHSYRQATVFIHQEQSDQAIPLFNDLLLGKASGSHGPLPEPWREMVQCQLHALQSKKHQALAGVVGQPDLSLLHRVIEKVPFEVEVIQGQPQCSVQGGALIYRSLEHPRRVMVRDLETLQPLPGFAPHGVEIKFIHPADGKNAPLFYLIEGDQFICGNDTRGKLNVLWVDLRSGISKTMTFITQRATSSSKVSPNLWQNNKLVYCSEAGNRSYQVSVFDLSTGTEINNFACSKLQRQILWTKIAGDHLLIGHVRHEGDRQNLVEVSDLCSSTLLCDIKQWGNGAAWGMIDDVDPKQQLYYALAAGEDQGQLHAWHYPTAKVRKVFPLGVRKLTDDTKPVFFLFPESNRLIVYKWREGKIQIWDTDAVILLKEVDHQMPVDQKPNPYRNFAFNGLACCFYNPAAGNQRVFHDAYTGQPIAQLPALKDNYNKIFASDDCTTVFGKVLPGSDYLIHVWRIKPTPMVVKTVRQTDLSLQHRAIDKLRFEVDISSGGPDSMVQGGALIYRSLEHPNRVMVRDLETLQPLPGFAPHGVAVDKLVNRVKGQTGMFYTIEDNQFICGNDNTDRLKVLCVDLRSGISTTWSFATKRATQDSQIRPNLWQGHKLVYCAQAGNNSYEIQVFDLISGAELNHFVCSQVQRQIIWTRIVGDHLLIGHTRRGAKSQYLVEVVDLSTQSLLCTISQFGNGVAWKGPRKIDDVDPRRQLYYALAADEASGALHAWHYPSGRVEKVFPLGGQKFTYDTMPVFFLHPETNRLIVYQWREQKIQIWDTDAVTLWREIDHPMPVDQKPSLSLNFAFNGMACCFRDPTSGSQRVFYDACSGKVLAQLPPLKDNHNKILSSDDLTVVLGQKLPNLQDDRIHVWRMKPAPMVVKAVKAASAVGEWMTEGFSSRPSQAAAPARPSQRGMFALSFSRVKVDALKYHLFVMRERSPGRLEIECLSGLVDHGGFATTRLCAAAVAQLKGDLSEAGCGDRVHVDVDRLSMTITGEPEVVHQVQSTLAKIPRIKVFADADDELHTHCLVQ